jgi:serine protease Do
MSFGIGAGAVSVLAAVLAVSPAARGDATAPRAEGDVRKSGQADRQVERKIDRQVRIVKDGGSYLGVRLEDVGEEDVARLRLPEEKGALVARVEGESPAQKAGLVADDVIVRYHGEGVLGASQLARLVRETPAGRTVPLEVVRNGSVQRLQVTLGDSEGSAWSLDEGLGRELGGHKWTFRVPPPPEAPEPPDAPMPPMPPSLPKVWANPHHLLDRMVWFGEGPRKLGLEYQEISGQLASYFKLEADEGVLVTSVHDDGPAGKAGLKAGDVILKLASREILDGDDLRRAVDKAEAGRETTITVQRDGRSVELKVTPAGPRREKEREGAEL